MSATQLPKQNDKTAISHDLNTIPVGPAILDRAIRQAVQYSWILMPPGKRSIAAVSEEMHRLVDRAIYDFEHDGRAF